MSPETRAFLDAVRTAEDPTPGDERRVLSAVHAALATGAIVSGGIAASKGVNVLGVSVATGVKAGGLVLGLSAAAWIAATALSPNPPAPAALSPARSAGPPASSAASVVPSPRSSDATPPLATESNKRPRTTTSPPPASPTATPSSPPPPSALPSLRDEIALLAEVNAALSRGDGATALLRLDEHDAAERRLLAERKALRIRALCLLGRTPEAERLARAFLREHPTSVQRTAVERSCAVQAAGRR
jgi:hypothetical protein